jgi:hypothetical protein
MFDEVSDGPILRQGASLCRRALHFRPEGSLHNRCPFILNGDLGLSRSRGSCKQFTPVLRHCEAAFTGRVLVLCRLSQGSAAYRSQCPLRPRALPSGFIAPCLPTLCQLTMANGVAWQERASGAFFWPPPAPGESGHLRKKPDAHLGVNQVRAPLAPRRLPTRSPPIGPAEKGAAIPQPPTDPPPPAPNPPGMVGGHPFRAPPHAPDARGQVGGSAADHCKTRGAEF